MAKLTLSDISNLQNETTVVATLAANNALIETALENTLSRDGTTPNPMSASLDMNSNRILNLPLPINDNEPARLVDIGDATGYAQDAEDSATAAAASASAAASSASTASTSATSASASASAASTSATSAATSATTSADNATVVVGNEYAFATSTTMADPSTGNLRFDNATIASAGNIAISALTNATGNPNIRTFIAAWDDSTNTNRGTLLIRKIGTPATFAVCTISGALTDNTTWLQLPITYVTGSGTFSASDRLSVQFTRAGDKGTDGSLSVTGTPTAGMFGIWTNATTQKGVSLNGIIRGNGASDPTVATTTDTLTIGTIELGAASDTTLSRSSAGVLAVEGNTVPVNSTSQTATFGTIELGAATDTTISRSSAGVIAVEGVTVPLNSTSSVHTASTIELGNASDTTLSRSSAGVLAVEGITVPLNSLTTSAVHTANTIELGHASDTTISRDSAGIIAVEGVPLYSQIPQNSKSAAYTTVLSDAQKHILHPSADTTARTFTIDSNANVAYPIGTVLTFINQNGAGTVTIAITSDTMRLAGAGITGSRTLAANGIAYATKLTSTEWIINGTGLT